MAVARSLRLRLGHQLSKLHFVRSNRSKFQQGASLAAIQLPRTKVDDADRPECKAVGVVDRRPCIEAKMGGTGDRRVADLHGSAVHYLEGRCGVPQVAMQGAAKRYRKAHTTQTSFSRRWGGRPDALAAWTRASRRPSAESSKNSLIPYQRAHFLRHPGRQGGGNGGVGSAPTPRQIPLVRIFMLDRRSANTPSKVRHHTTS